MSRRLSAVLLFSILVLVAIALIEPFSNSAARLARSNSKFVTVDVLPGHANKVLDRGGNPFVPVAIYGSSTFDATSVDPSTIRFAGAPVIQRANGKLKFKIKDVNNDGRDDLLAFVWAKDLRVAGNVGAASLSARSFDGFSIAGSQLIQLNDSRPGAWAPERKNVVTKNASRVDDSRITPNVDVTFCNATSIVMGAGAGAPAAPFPSNIVVASLPPLIAKVTVQINNFGHTFPDDVDMLLVGPGGQNAIIWSDVGGTGPPGASGINITLDDAAASSLPDAGPLVSGTFKPTNSGVAVDTWSAPAPAPAGTSVLSVFNGTNPNGTWNLYVQDDGGGDGGSIGGGYCVTFSTTPTATDGSITGAIVDNSGAAVSGVAVSLSGTQSRKTITDVNGNYHFDNVETNGFYTVTPTRANYVFGPSSRSFSLLGQHTDATFNAASTGGGLNPLDTTEYFVRQQYLDFLGREPDEAGFNFWVNNIESCGADQNCRAVKRTDTSAAFFVSIEFQQTGYLVYRMYQAAYGDMPGAPVPLRLGEFRPDTAEIGNGVIVNRSGWEAVLESNRQAYAAGFVQRTRFLSLYGNMSDGQFVDTLNQNAGFVLSQSERDQLVSDLSSQAKTRAQVLRSVTENTTLSQQEFNQAFVLMQYFGYLRRDPNSGPDADFTGYNFWLNKLNTFGNYQDAELVKAFLVAGEYRGRFPR